MADGKQWYVLRIVGGKEKKAAELLEKEVVKYKFADLVDKVLIPTEKVYKIKDGKRVCTERLLMPGYGLIHCELTPALENLIRNDVPNVAGFLTEKRTGGDRKAVAVPDAEIDRILGTQDESIQNEGAAVVDFIVGDPVTVAVEPFKGFKGVVEAIVEDRSKLKVAVMIFGRKTLLELNFAQVTKD